MARPRVQLGVRLGMQFSKELSEDLFFFLTTELLELAFIDQSYNTTEKVHVEGVEAEWDDRTALVAYVTMTPTLGFRFAF